MKRTMSLTPYSAVQYSKEKYPALKFYLPLDEGNGAAAFTDRAGGLIWTPQASGSASLADMHSVANAVTCKSYGIVDATIGGSGSLSGYIPAPNKKVSIAIAVFGPVTTTGSADGDFMYLRMGEAISNDDFVYSWNSNNEAGNNCIKNQSSIVPGSAWITQAGYSVQTIVGIWTDPSTLTTNYYVNNTKSTSNTPVTNAAHAIVNDLRPLLSLTSVPTNPRSGVTPEVSLFSLQFWHFDAVPSDLTTAALWTKENAILGNKNPYPGWAYKA